MCGRFTLRTPAEKIARAFDLPAVPQLTLRFNIAPTQPVLCVRQAVAGGREAAMLRWGLIPFWADDVKIGYSTINARAETVAAKPAFRDAFKRRRCLVVADGYYEWQPTDDKKQPYYIRRRDDEPFAFAGLWERWHREEPAIESCTIIVTDCNPQLRAIHDRMPVVLRPSDYDVWLDPEFENRDVLQNLLRPADDDFTVVPVSTKVNSPRNDVPECIEPLPT